MDTKTRLTLIEFLQEITGNYSNPDMELNSFVKMSDKELVQTCSEYLHWSNPILLSAKQQLEDSMRNKEHEPEPVARSCFDPECEGCYACSQQQYKCDCKQYKQINHCIHIATLGGHGW